MIDLVYKIYKNNKILKIIDLNPITSEKELYDLLNPLYKENVEKIYKKKWYR